jgi:predicted enzyme related to lactoylglutathione lyase
MKMKRRRLGVAREEEMQVKLAYVIKFVKDMDVAVRFHRDTLGLALKFQSPEWSEFSTGETTLALHAASEANPAGGVELGYSVKNLKDVYSARQSNGLSFTSEPKPLHGTLLGTILDSEGARCSISDA